MAVTIKDIAKAAGVSHSTVSRALKDNPLISPETTARVQALAEEMGYIPNTIAQNLLAQHTDTIGIVVTTIADPFMTQVVEGIEMRANEAGFNILLSMSHNDPDREMAVVETFQRRRVDAIIVTSSRVGSLYNSQLNKTHIPVVLINNQQEGQYIYSVAVDDQHGAQLAVDHLLALGHHKIGYLGVPDRPKSDQRRLAGYHTAMAEAGELPPMVFNVPGTIDNDFARGEAALDALLQARVTAVFCYNDMTAIGLMVACWRRGITIPDDLSVVGFDDVASASYATPPLTTIHQPRHKLGTLAMSMVLDLLDKRNVHNQLLTCRLVARESTAPPAAVPSTANDNL